MVAALSFSAAAGRACGIGFNAAAHLKAHPEFAWQKELLRDMPSGSWTMFSARQRPGRARQQEALCGAHVNKAAARTREARR